MISDSDYRHWLSLPHASRVVLVELHHSAGIEYVASRPYVTQPTDTLANQPFNDLLVSAVDVTTRLDAQLSLGDLTVTNTGELDHWVDYAWRGWPVVMRLGDTAWSYDDFRIIARQANGGIQSARRGELVMTVYDASAQFDQPVSGRPLIDDQPAALILGRVFSAPATRVSSQSLTYQVSALPVSALVVRDGTGPVLSHSAQYSSGRFTLSNYTPRSVVCEVVEPHDTPASIVQWVADHYSVPVASGVLPALPGYRLGLRYDGAVSGRQILDDLCLAIGGYWRLNLLGELVVQRLEQPTQPEITLTADDLVRDGLALIRTEAPVRSITLNYNRNHSPLSEVAGSIHDSDPALAKRLQQEWLAVTRTQNLPTYPMADERTHNVGLVDAVDVISECQRRLQLRQHRRDSYELEVFMVFVGDLVGRAIQVDHPRLAGRIGRVLSCRLSPDADRATLEVWY